VEEACNIWNSIEDRQCVVNCGSPLSTNGGNSSEESGSGNRGSRKRGHSGDSSSNDTRGNKRGRHISFSPESSSSSSSNFQTDQNEDVQIISSAQKYFDGCRNNLPNREGDDKRGDDDDEDDDGNLIDPDRYQEHEQRKRSTSEGRLLRELPVRCITN
jgi:hypothetical protein